ncbi:MAG: hypothetical protein RL609_865 [Bacteroidota bacterium]|jgi:hypothetical protein
MNELKTYKRLTWALIILNLIVVGFFTLGPRLFGPHGPHRPNHGPKELIEDQLNLNVDQKEKFHHLIHQHIEQIKEQNEIIMGIRQKMYEAHFRHLSTDSIQSDLCQAIGGVELINIKHLEEIRNICTEEQQVHFDEIAKNWARIFTDHPIKP